MQFTILTQHIHLQLSSPVPWQPLPFLSTPLLGQAPCPLLCLPLPLTRCGLPSVSRLPRRHAHLPALRAGHWAPFLLLHGKASCSPASTDHSSWAEETSLSWLSAYLPIHTVLFLSVPVTGFPSSSWCLPGICPHLLSSHSTGSRVTLGTPRNVYCRGTFCWTALLGEPWTLHS